MTRMRQGANGFQGDAERYRPESMSDFEFNSCWRKIDYDNEKRAQNAIKRMKKAPFYDSARAEPRPYLCPFCRSWHIGSRKTREEKEIERQRT